MTERSIPAPTDAGALADDPFEMSVEVQTDYERGMEAGKALMRNMADDVLAQALADELEVEALKARVVDLNRRLARNSAPQETRGDEPQDWSGMITRPIDAVIAVSAQDPRVIIAGIRLFGLAPDGSDLRDLERALAASQQSPRLEREGIARALVKRRFPWATNAQRMFELYHGEDHSNLDGRFRTEIQTAYADADAILALLSAPSLAPLPD